MTAPRLVWVVVLHGREIEVWRDERRARESAARLHGAEVRSRPFGRVGS